jgi:hypothetical protein
MTITAEFRNRTAGFAVGDPVTVEAPDADIANVFRRLLYRYGQIVHTEKVDSLTRRYTLKVNGQYPDTRDNYELETTLTVTKETPFHD